MFILTDFRHAQRTLPALIDGARSNHLRNGDACPKATADSSERKVRNARHGSQNQRRGDNERPQSERWQKLAHILCILWRLADSVTLARLTHGDHPFDMPAQVRWSKVAFVSSVVHVERFPKTRLPVVAVAGCSNAGKSSLLNRLFQRKSLVKTSKTPGKTRLLNLFEVDHAILIVDLPGYGFSKVSKKEMAGWQKLIQGFLQSDRSPQLVLILMDVRHAPKPSDVLLIEWLNHHGLRWVPVVTKADKLSKGQLAQRIRHIRDALGCDPIVTSSKDGRGVDALRMLIERELIGQAPTKS